MLKKAVLSVHCSRLYAGQLLQFKHYLHFKTLTLDFYDKIYNDVGIIVLKAHRILSSMLYGRLFTSVLICFPPAYGKEGVKMNFVDRIFVGELTNTIMCEECEHVSVCGFILTNNHMITHQAV